MKTDNVAIGMVDDHDLFRNGIASILSKEPNFRIIMHEKNGVRFLARLSEMEGARLPDIVVTDVNMPSMDGFEILHWLRINYPNIRTVALSMNGNDISILKMINRGVNAYLHKGMDIHEIIAAIRNVAANGNYFDNLFGPEREVKIGDWAEKFGTMPESEKEWTRLLSTDLPLNQIGSHFNTSVGQVLERRDEIFRYFNVWSRPQLAVMARTLSLR